MKHALAFDYQVTYSQRKTLSIYVKEANVEVRAPKGTNLAVINQFLLQKSPWVERKLASQKKQLQEKPSIAQGLPILFMGQYKKLVISQGKNQVLEQQHHLAIHCQSPDKAEQLLSNWLKQEAKLYIAPRCEELAIKMGVSQKINAINFRKTKSKWGHCTSQGTLQFNWLLIMAPIDVIDYVIIHELCHLTHMNHSPAFWQLVAKFCPDYLNHKTWLKQQGHRISL